MHIDRTRCIRWVKYAIIMKMLRYFLPQPHRLHASFSLAVLLFRNVDGCCCLSMCCRRRCCHTLLFPVWCLSVVSAKRINFWVSEWLSVGLYTQLHAHTHTAMQLKKLLLSLFRSLVDSHWIMISWFASLASFRECALKSNKISSGIAFQSNNDFYHKPHHNQLNLIAIAYPLSIFIK